MERRDLFVWIAGLFAFEAGARDKASPAVIVKGDVKFSRTGKFTFRAHTRQHSPGLIRVGKSAFLVSPDSDIELQHDDKFGVEILRLISGAVHSVFDPSVKSKRLVITPHAVIAIRGTAHYAEVLKQLDRTYTCCCYGHVTIRDTANQSLDIISKYHTAKVIDGKNGIADAPYDSPLNHYDDTLISVEAMLGRVPRWSLPNQVPQFFAPPNIRDFVRRKIAN